MSTAGILQAADGAALLACGAVAAALIGRQRQHERLYGGGRLRLRRPRRRVPGLTRDGAPLGEQDEAAIDAMERGWDGDSG